MPRSPMVPVRSDLHGSLAAVRPQLRKLCALLGTEECAKVFASPVLRVDSNGCVSAEAAVACLLGRLADAFSSVLEGGGASRSVATVGASSRPRKVRRGRAKRSSSRQQPQVVLAPVQPAPSCGAPAVMPQPGVSSFLGADGYP
jgi:hypothetical protein